MKSRNKLVLLAIMIGIGKCHDSGWRNEALAQSADGTPGGSNVGGGTRQLRINGKPAAEGQLKRSLFRHGLVPFEVGRYSITASTRPIGTTANSSSPARLRR